MKTPEGKLKDQVKAFLRGRGVASLSAPVENAVGYYHMYVPSGYGDPTLDFTGCYKGRFFAIETKAEGKKITARQALITRRIQESGGWVTFGWSFQEISGELNQFFRAVDQGL